MIRALRRPAGSRGLGTWAIVAAVLGLAFLLGQRASPLWLALLAAGMGGVVLLAQPALGLLALVAVSLLLPIEFGTGTDVRLNAASLLVPVLALIWLLDVVRHHRVHAAPTRANLPLLLFLGTGLLSLLIGRATWDPAVPIRGDFLLVQLAQWAIFAFSAFAFWLAANRLRDVARLRRFTLAFLTVAGILAIASVSLGARTLVNRTATVALIRTPFWLLLCGLAGGQLLFNTRLSLAWRAFLLLSLAGVGVYAFSQEQEATSNWVGVAAVAGVLIWLRWPRLRWPMVAVVVLLAMIGVLFPSVYQFAGGDAEWQTSGGSRLALIQRVIEVTMRNPITGLGPAAYRPYANATPLQYGRTYWVTPLINSHNNYVDIFAHTGLVGLGLFLWFMAEVAWLAWRLRRRFQVGFASGYINGMLATWAGIMVVMLLLDWFLPFVYNVGFPGFQASVLVWLFLGGLVAIEQWPISPSAQSGPNPRR